jgi:hypothetical protein
MEGKVNQDFGAFADKANVNRNDTLMINSAFGNLQNFPDLDAITKSRNKQNDIMAIMKMVAVNAYKIGFARAINHDLTDDGFQSLLYDRDFQEVGKVIQDDLLTINHLFH